MSVRLLDNRDRQILEKFLSPHKAQCMFICSNLQKAGVDYQDEMFQGEYFGSFNKELDQIEGIIVHYWNGNIMMLCPDLRILNNLIDVLSQHITRPVAGILGEYIQAEFVINKLNLSGADYAANENEGLYTINTSELLDLPMPSNFKSVEANQVAKITLRNWIKNYEIEALGAEDYKDLESRVKDKVTRLRSGDCWVLLKDEVPVHLSAFNARIDGMVQIGPVWTPPEYRNQGFAKMLLVQNLIKAREQGVTEAILFASDSAAISAYTAVGFRMIGNYRLAILRKEVELKFDINI
ncbi:MAG: GNAT family N-acetyltransferase [Rickettsiaceae bacterium]|nr:GNAT family N-acetyltransferase [Rickettsiaceae bacterium]